MTPVRHIVFRPMHFLFFDIIHIYGITRLFILNCITTSTTNEPEYAHWCSRVLLMIYPDYRKINLGCQQFSDQQLELKSEFRGEVQ